VNKYFQIKTPRWSPNASEIAFTDSNDVYIMDSDGSNLIQLTRETDIFDYYIDWSPEGNKIAIASTDKEQAAWQIRLFDLNTKKIDILLEANTKDDIFGISWSPDGREIVFTSNRDLEGDGTGLFKVTISTGEISPLPYLSNYVFRTDRYPRWSPDGQHIAFISDIDGSWNVYLTGKDGSSIQQLTDDINAPSAGNHVYFGGTLSWSPDSSSIIFSACPSVYPEGCELFMINADGTDFVQLTNDKENGAFDPDWKPTFPENIDPAT
jgi:TolB protein